MGNRWETEFTQAGYFLTGWVERTTKNSELDDTAGNGKRIRKWYDSKISSDPFNKREIGFHISGPDGCGKHMAMLHLINVVKADYRVFYINKSAFDLDNMNLESFLEIIKYLFEEYADVNKICIIFDGFDNYLYQKELYLYLYDILVSRFNNVEPDVLLVIMDNGGTIPSLLSSMLYSIRVRKPTKKQREVFLDRKIEEALVEALGEKIEEKQEFLVKIFDIKQIAEETEGFTYRDLLLLVESISSLFLDEFDENEIEEELHMVVAEEKKKHYIENQTGEKMLAKMDNIFLALSSSKGINTDALLSKIDALIESISKISVTTGVTSTNKSVDIVQADDTIQPATQFGKDGPKQFSKKEISKQPVKEVVARLEKFVASSNDEIVSEMMLENET